jgi:hypothetical protein
VGTLTFMSPERINGGDYSFSADVWSLGLTVLTTALGRLPLETEGGYWSVMACVREEEPPTLPEGGAWSDGFRDFLAQCLTKDEAARPTCAQLLAHPFVAGAAGHAAASAGAEGDAAAAAEELENILDAVVVHAGRMLERGGRFERAGGGGDGNTTMANMLGEMVLKDTGLLANLAAQLRLEPEVVESTCSKTCHRAVMASYLDED